MKKIDISFAEGGSIEDVLFNEKPIRECIVQLGKEKYTELAVKCSNTITTYMDKAEGFKAVMIPDMVLDTFMDEENLTIPAYIFGTTLAAATTDEFKEAIICNPLMKSQHSAQDIFDSYLDLYELIITRLNPKEKPSKDHAHIFATTIMGCYDMWMTLRKHNDMEQLKGKIKGFLDKLGLLGDMLDEDDD